MEDGTRVGLRPPLSRSHGPPCRRHRQPPPPRSEWLPAVTYRYIPAHTGTYRHIPSHTVTYPASQRVDSETSGVRMAIAGARRASRRASATGVHCVEDAFKGIQNKGSDMVHSHPLGSKIAEAVEHSTNAAKSAASVGATGLDRAGTVCRTSTGLDRAGTQCLVSTGFDRAGTACLAGAGAVCSNATSLGQSLGQQVGEQIGQQAADFMGSTSRHSHPLGRYTRPFRDACTNTRHGHHSWARA